MRKKHLTGYFISDAVIGEYAHCAVITGRVVRKRILARLDKLSGETTLSQRFCLPYKNRSALKGKNLLPWGANSFLLEQTQF